jgi:DNA-binding NarL/FixJ family response regulator
VERSSAVTIVSGIPLFGTSLRQWLESGQPAVRCCLFGDRETGWDPHAPVPGIALLIPQSWRDMRLWLPALQQQYASHPWLFLGDLRIAGMFFSALECQSCTLLPPGASPDRLRLSLRALSEGVVLCPPATIAHLIANGCPGLAHDESAFPTRREIECGCAASLGLTNRQIAHELRLSEGTVKGYISRLMRRLHLKEREGLSLYLEQVLTPLPGLIH